TNRRTVEDGIGNSVVGRVFDVRDGAISITQGWRFDITSSTKVFRPFNAGSFDYHIGEENNSFARSYIQENYANGTEYQIRYTHRDRQGFAMMMSYQGESRLAFYGLNSHSGEHYGLGKSNR